MSEKTFNAIQSYEHCDNEASFAASKGLLALVIDS